MSQNGRLGSYLVEERGSDELSAIEVRSARKVFKLYDNPVTGPLKDLLLFWRPKAMHRKFVSVDDVDFKVQRGEVVGIIGPNGAGKTTLLRMIAGLLPVDSGSITVRGRITALLALGVGVHPEFTGRENIYYGGLLLGMSRQEILDKTPSIVDFAELGEFIDMPFRTYSSGMRARLLFSIAMSVEPDILIVDEALATGDAYFVTKCINHIRRIIRSGATILYVSHNLTQVQELCERAIFMANGRICAEGDPISVVAAYNEWTFQKERARAGALAVTGEGEPRPIGGNGAVRITAARLLDRGGSPADGFHTGDLACLELDYVSDLPAPSVVNVFIGFVREEDGQWIGEINSKYYVSPHSDGVQKVSMTLNGTGTVRAVMHPLLLLNGHYHFWVIIYGEPQYYCEYRNLAPFFVAREANVFDRGPAYWQPCELEAR